MGDLLDRKQSISLLMPFEGQFYYRYGWPFCYFHQQIKIMPRELRCAAKPWGNIRQAELQDAVDIMQRIYGAFIQNYDGAVERSAESWKLLLKMQHWKIPSAICWSRMDRQRPTVYGIRSRTMERTPCLSVRWHGVVRMHEPVCCSF